ncbi:MAG: Rossmann-like and DUF2520 domain-containing protein [Candidatus Omnitrophota bacterium]
MDENIRSIKEIGRRFSVIGAGSLGIPFAWALIRKGYHLKYIYKKIKREIREWEAAIASDLGRIVQESDFVIISVQESKIRETAESIAMLSHPEEKIFFHTSNSLTSDELAVLKEKGAHVASFSPLQTFSGNAFDPDIHGSSDLFQGIYFLAEGDPEALNLAEGIASDLNAHVLRVEKKNKIYFHMAAVCASNFLISILKLSERQLKKVGGDIGVLLPLVKQTLKNVEQRGVEASLTGPVKRKESGIIQKHLEHLHGDEAELYRMLTEFLKT